MTIKGNEMESIKDGIARYRQEKRDLENRICSMITEHLSNFNDATGCHVLGIEIQMVEVTTIQDIGTRANISGVKVRTNLR